MCYSILFYSIKERVQQTKRTGKKTQIFCCLVIGSTNHILLSANTAIIHEHFINYLHRIFYLCGQQRLFPYQLARGREVEPITNIVKKLFFLAYYCSKINIKNSLFSVPLVMYYGHPRPGALLLKQTKYCTSRSFSDIYTKIMFKYWSYCLNYS